PEVPAAQWRPWFMGLKQNILEELNSLILTPMTHVLKYFRMMFGFVYQPEFYFLDVNGTLIQKLIGPVSEEQFRNLFNSNLQ
ncbi:MAG: hypothetical protein HC797_09715, partial [Anaerolineales bacterium]|nr:hypothetical protein [Anaerolineales bacterium]